MLGRALEFNAHCSHDGVRYLAVGSIVEFELKYT